MASDTCDGHAYQSSVVIRLDIALACGHDRSYPRYVVIGIGISQSLDIRQVGAGSIMKFM